MPPEMPPRHHPHHPQPRKFRRSIGIVIAGLIICVAIVSSIVRVPKRWERPGEVAAMEHFVTVPGADDSSDGSFYLLTVRVANEDMRLIEDWLSHFDDEQEIIETEELLGGYTDEEDDCRGINEMVAAQADAQLAVAEVLGTPVDEVQFRVIAAQLTPESPAAKALKVCDRITEVDGKPVLGVKEAGDLIRRHSPGESVELTILRNGATMTLDVPTIAVKDSDGTERTAVGVSLFQVVEPSSLPFGIEIDPEQITGPSAGLGFSLEILDQLTPGSLSGGKNVAVTGTIDAEGNVGVIGGARLKAISARRAKSDYMIVPNGDLKEAKQGAGSMKVYGVDTLEDALTILKKNGGDPLPEPIPATEAAPS